MALRGRLQDLSVVDLVKIHCFGKARACVKIVQTEVKAEIYFDKGSIIAAHYGSLTGLEALSKALDIEEGKYQIELYCLPSQKNIDRDWKEIIECRERGDSLS